MTECIWEDRADGKVKCIKCGRVHPRRARVECETKSQRSRLALTVESRIDDELNRGRSEGKGVVSVYRTEQILAICKACDQFDAVRGCRSVPGCCSGTQLLRRIARLWGYCPNDEWTNRDHVEPVRSEAGD